jgi:undecaprenol kinase
MMDREAVNRIFPQEQLPPRELAMLGAARSWRARSRWRAIRCAAQGLRDAWATQINFRIHCAAAAAVVVLSAWLGLSSLEWLWISFAIGIVIFAELMNTAIEQTVDLVVGSRQDPLARQVKDVAAGFVLVAAMIAAVIGTLTLVPHLIVR